MQDMDIFERTQLGHEAEEDLGLVLGEALVAKHIVKELACFPISVSVLESDVHIEEQGAWATYLAIFIIPIIWKNWMSVDKCLNRVNLSLDLTLGFSLLHFSRFFIRFTAIRRVLCRFRILMLQFSQFFQLPFLDVLLVLVPQILGRDQSHAWVGAYLLVLSISSRIVRVDLVGECLKDLCISAVIQASHVVGRKVLSEEASDHCVVVLDRPLHRTRHFGRVIHHLLGGGHASKNAASAIHYLLMR